MSRVWRPGDVAIRSYLGSDQVSLFVKCHGHRKVDALHWHHENGGFDPDHAEETDYPTYRPLVVLDPEDREQVERLIGLLGDHGWRPTEAHGLRDALREFADPTPPKPAEPTGLGAVVEDAKGNRWVRFCETSSPAWCSEPYDDADYADIDVVKVLSDGVTS